jgi:hypothetical protein
MKRIGNREKAGRDGSCAPSEHDPLPYKAFCIMLNCNIFRRGYTIVHKRTHLTPINANFRAAAKNKLAMAEIFPDFIPRY